MAAQPLSAERIRQIVLGRIRAGQYGVGSRIPTNRALAEELGANRNTVNKALQGLARDGILSLMPGRGGGAFVLRDGAAERAGDQLRLELERLAGLASQSGLSRQQALELARDAINAAYDSQPLRLKFLECNIHDVQTLAAQLTRLIDCPLETGVIDQEDLPGLGMHYDLVITTFHHLAEVSRALGAERAKVVGVNAVPTTDVSLAIARLEARRLGLVCSRETTVQSMKYLLASYHPNDELAVALLDDEPGVQRLAATSEALIATYSCADEVLALSGRRPDVIVEFQIEAQSVEFVRRSIARLRTRAATGM